MCWCSSGTTSNSSRAGISGEGQGGPRKSREEQGGPEKGGERAASCSDRTTHPSCRIQPCLSPTQAPSCPLEALGPCACVIPCLFPFSMLASSPAQAVHSH